MASNAPKDPWRSSRLHYRAVRAEEDKAVFAAMSADSIGYQNSSIGNISLPSASSTQAFMDSMLSPTEQLLGAIIWLPHAPATTPEQIKEMKEKSEFGPGLVESWGTAIGEIHLSRGSPTTAHHRNTTLGIDILPGYQGRGYGGEAIEWALEYAFHRAGLHRVRIRAFEWNVGAVRLYERLGFVREGREREALWFEGRWWDGIDLGMLEGEWRTLREKKTKQEQV